MDLESAKSNTPCKQIQPLSRIKTLNGPRVHRISPVGKEKVCGGNDLPESQVLGCVKVFIFIQLIAKYCLLIRVQGWSSVVASDMNHFYNVVVNEAERTRVELLEPFDEYEEWHLKCAHYMLLTAFSGSCLDLASVVWPRLSSHFCETNCEVLNSRNVEVVDADCGTFVAAFKQFCLSPNAKPICTQIGCDMTEPVFSAGTELLSSKVEPNQSLHLQETRYQVVTSDIGECKYGLHWKEAELTFIGGETDSRCQRFGHTANVLLINGQRRMVTVGGFGVASCGRHRRLSDVTSWNLPPTAASETYSVDSGGLLSRMCHATVMLGNSTLGNATFGNSSLVVVGGRRSPTSPVLEHVVLVDFADVHCVSCHEVVCSGDVPDLCWRHTAVHAVINGMLILSIIIYYRVTR